MTNVINGEKFCAFYITAKSYRRYFSGVDVDEGYVVVIDAVYYFTDARYFSGVKDQLRRTALPMLYESENSIKDFLFSKGIETLYIDYDNTTLTEYNSLLKWGLNVKDASDTLKLLRKTKRDSELDCIQRACAITQKAFYAGLSSIRTGITELELKEIIENHMQRFGGEQPSFDTIVAFGANSAVPHHQSDNTKLEPNTAVLVDMGCKVNGYASDLTRTAFFGTPNLEFLRVYNSVKKANLVAEQNIFDGISVKEADELARQSLVVDGYGEFFTHSLGHGVGLDIHEPPTLSPKGNGTLCENTVFTIEPGVYLDGKFGVRIEDTVVIKNGKVKRLFTDDKELIILTDKF